jgi:hypothetical protein
MNKFFAVVVLAISPIFAIAAPSQGSISESLSGSNSYKSRSLDSNGVLTEMNCVFTSNESASSTQECFTRVTQLKGSALSTLRSAMTVSESALVAQAATKSAYSTSSEADSGSSSMSSYSKTSTSGNSSSGRSSNLRLSSSLNN